MRAARVLHTSALTAYADGSLLMGAVVALTATPGAQLVIPASCLITAWARHPKDARLIEYLTRLGRADGSRVGELIPLSPEHFPLVAPIMAADMAVDLATAHAAAVAMSHRLAVIADRRTAELLARVAPSVAVEALP